MAQANIKAVITAEDRASHVLKGFSNSVASVGNHIKQSMKVAAVAFAAAGTTAAVFAVKSAADFEQTRIGLEAMLGSADKARVLLKDLSKFAAETPFEFPELAAATRQLVAYGFSGDEAFKTIKKLGDVAAGTQTPMSDLAYLFGTLRVQGRAFSKDIYQFTNRGIDVTTGLAKVMGVAKNKIMEMVEEGKIGFPEVQKAIEMMSDKGGQFHNMMAKQSKSLSGLFSTLKDVIGQTARELVGITSTGDAKAGSVFDRLRQALAWLIANLPRMIQTMKDGINSILPTLQQWGRNIADVARQVAEYLWPKLQSLWVSIRENLIPALREMWKTYGIPLAKFLGTTLVFAIGLLIDALKFISDHIEILSQVFIAFGALLIGKKVHGAIDTVRVAIIGQGGLKAALVNLAKYIAGPSLLTPWGLIAIAAGLAAAAIIRKWSQVRSTLKSTEDALNNFAKAADNAMHRMDAAVKKGKATAAEAARLRASIEQGRRDIEESKSGIFNLGNMLKDAVSPVLKPRKKAAGGLVNAGQSYLVGEKGPEMFKAPSGGGRIIPNTRSGNTTINVSVNAQAFMGSPKDARKLASIVAEALKDIANKKGMSTNALLGTP